MVYIVIIFPWLWTEAQIHSYHRGLWRAFIDNNTERSYILLHPLSSLFHNGIYSHNYQWSNIDKASMNQAYIATQKRESDSTPTAVLKLRSWVLHQKMQNSIQLCHRESCGAGKFLNQKIFLMLYFSALHMYILAVLFIVFKAAMIQINQSRCAKCEL